MSTDRQRIRHVLDQTFAWSRQQDYLEHTKHDALNSPLVWAVCGQNRITRILATQMVMRSPFDIRGLVGVPRSENPKGLALFVMALLDAFQWSGEEHYRLEAERLLERLLALRSPGNWSGSCWGYQYPWQDLGFFAPKATPNAVVTAFVCEAFLQAFRVTGERAMLAPVEEASRFFLHDLTVLKDEAEEMCLAYMPLAMNMRVMDVSILVASVLAQLAEIHDSRDLRRAAVRLTNYVVGRQTPEGAWYYTDPPQDSPVKIDNYHTGFILDALDRVMAALVCETWREQHVLGTDFYATHLFNPDGSPRWMSDRDYPHDIHGAAQGILTFSAGRSPRHSAIAPAIIDWALSRMYHPQGRFYYQETRFYRKKFTFLRWCNAWMCRALSSHLRCTRNAEN